LRHHLLDVDTALARERRGHAHAVLRRPILVPRVLGVAPALDEGLGRAERAHDARYHRRRREREHQDVDRRDTPVEFGCATADGGEGVARAEQFGELPVRPRLADEHLLRTGMGGADATASRSVEWPLVRGRHAVAVRACCSTGGVARTPAFESACAVAD
jgi:hypothetical protein